MDAIKIGNLELRSKAPLFGPIRRLAAAWTKARPEEFLALCGAAIGMAADGRFPWGTLAEAGHDLIEFGDRVVDALERGHGIQPLTIAEVGPDVAAHLFKLLPDYAAAEAVAGN
jgi:hypothetical protein